jgi:hypothetical protein
MEPKASGLLLILAAAAGRAIDFLAARVVSLHSPPPPIGSRQAIDQGELEDQWEVSSRIAAPGVSRVASRDQWDLGLSRRLRSQLVNYRGHLPIA